MTQQQGSQSDNIPNMEGCQNLVSIASKILAAVKSLESASYNKAPSQKKIQEITHDINKSANEIKDCDVYLIYLEEHLKNAVQATDVVVDENADPKGSDVPGGCSESNNGFFQTIYSYVSSGWKYVESNPISSFLAVCGGLVASGYLYSLVSSSAQKAPSLKNSKVQLKSISYSNSKSVNHLSKDKNSDNDSNSQSKSLSKDKNSDNDLNEGVGYFVSTNEVSKTGDVSNDAAFAA